MQVLEVQLASLSLALPSFLFSQESGVPQSDVRHGAVHHGEVRHGEAPHGQVRVMGEVDEVQVVCELLQPKGRLGDVVNPTHDADPLPSRGVLQTLAMVITCDGNIHNLQMVHIHGKDCIHGGMVHPPG